MSVSTNGSATRQSVEGKIAIVTGGGSGIGYCFCALLHSKGCNVVIGDLRLTGDAEKLVSEAKSKGGAKVLFKECDVTNWKQLEDLFTYTEKEVGAPDIVCPGAGIFEPKWSNFFYDTETNDHYKMIDINITHPTKATRLAVRSFLKANKKGIVAHISSIGGQTCALQFPIYCSTKAYINHLVRCLADLDEKAGIKVCAVAPGLVKTPLWFKENPDKLKMYDGSTEVPWIMPEEIAEVLLEVAEGMYEGGAVIEATGQDRRRLVELFNDPGPFGAKRYRRPDDPVIKEMLEILEKEKGAPLNQF